jgi:hypothetical protein
MSPRGLRARLKRLEKKIKMIEPPRGVCDFKVDPALAKALRDDHLRANKLERDFNSPAEWFEAMRLRERNVERAQSIPCPADYGSEQAGRDENRLHALSSKRDSPGGSLTDAEDVEEAQLTARLAAYEAEVRGENRKFELMLKRSVDLTPEEKSEYEHLKTLYPDGPMDPDDPMKPVLDMIMKRDAARARPSHDDEGP